MSHLLLVLQLMQGRHSFLQLLFAWHVENHQIQHILLYQSCHAFWLISRLTRLSLSRSFWSLALCHSLFIFVGPSACTSFSTSAMASQCASRQCANQTTILGLVGRVCYWAGKV